MSNGGLDPLVRRSRPPERPRLQLVPDPAVVARARRRRRLFTGLTAVTVVGGLFAVVGLQVFLTQGQAQLDALEVRVDTEQKRHQQLRLQVAQMESPSRVVDVARERLGMEPIKSVTYLSPLPAQNGSAGVPAADPGGERLRAAEASPAPG